MHHPNDTLIQFSREDTRNGSFQLYRDKFLHLSKDLMASNRFCWSHNVYLHTYEFICNELLGLIILWCIKLFFVNSQLFSFLMVNLPVDANTRIVSVGVCAGSSIQTNVLIKSTFIHILLTVFAGVVWWTITRISIDPIHATSSVLANMIVQSVLINTIIFVYLTFASFESYLKINGNV